MSDAQRCIPKAPSSRSPGHASHYRGFGRDFEIGHFDAARDLRGN